MKAPISAIPIYVAFGSSVRGEEKGKGVEEVMTKVDDSFWVNLITFFGLLIISGILFYFLRKRVEKDFNRRMSSFNNFPNLTNRRSKDARGEESDRTSSMLQQNGGEDDKGDGSAGFGGDNDDDDDDDDDEKGKKYKREKEPLEVEILTV